MRHTDVPPHWNLITEQVIGAAMEVHSILGPGLLEKLYEDAMAYELNARKIPFVRQAPVRLRYKEITLSEQTLDLLVSDFLVVELKSMELVPNLHLDRLMSYMHSMKYPLGLCINFNVSRLKDGIFRRVLTRNTPSPPIFDQEL